MQIAALIIFVGSFLGMAVLVFRKVPALLLLPAGTEKPIRKKFLDRVKGTGKNFPVFGSFSYDKFMQKTLAKIRILILKTDNKTSNWLKRLRMKEKIRKNLQDNYWDSFKKTKNQK